MSIYDDAKSVMASPTSTPTSPLQSLDTGFREALNDLHSKITDLGVKLNPLCTPEQGDSGSNAEDYAYESEFETAMYIHLRSITYAFQRLAALQDRLRV